MFCLELLQLKTLLYWQPECVKYTPQTNLQENCFKSLKTHLCHYSKVESHSIICALEIVSVIFKIIGNLKGIRIMQHLKNTRRWKTQGSIFIRKLYLMVWSLKYWNHMRYPTFILFHGIRPNHFSWLDESYRITVKLYLAKRSVYTKLIHSFAK